MTIRETYEYLDSIRVTEAAIVKEQILIAEMRSCLLPKAITYDGDRVQTSPSDTMSSIVADIADRERDLERLKARKAELIKDISLAISKLQDDNEQIILIGYYIGRLPMKKVAAMAHYSPRGAYKVKKRAVAKLSKVCTKCSS